MRTGVFVGSFDPFHAGHKNIAQRALQLFDRVVIGIGVNPEKRYLYSVEERIAIVREAMSEESNVSVEAYDGLTIEFVRQHGAQYIVKGVRNAEDFAYEQQQAEWNKLHGGIETILFFAEPELKELSSTKIREKNDYL